MTQKKLVIKRATITTKYLDFNKIKPIVAKTGLNSENLDNIKSGKFQIKNLKLDFDENFKLKQDLAVGGDLKKVNIKISKN